MNATFKALLMAARLRTLPLAIAVIASGDVCARLFASNYRFEISFWVLITTLLLQILSNYANDYGDFKKGTDTAANRKDRALASGALSVIFMRNVLVVTAFLTLLVGLNLLRISFDGNLQAGFLFMFGLGILSILAAIGYTVSKYAFGYKALGDLFVFLFFGPLAIFGTVYLQEPTFFQVFYTKTFFALISASFCLGFATTCVLNINNIRDLEKDKAVNKITIPVILGFEKAKIYHFFLVSGLVICLSLFGFFTEKSVLLNLMISLFASSIYFFRAAYIFKAKPQTDFSYYNKELKFFSLLVLLIPILLWL